MCDTAAVRFQKQKCSVIMEQRSSVRKKTSDLFVIAVLLIFLLKINVNDKCLDKN
jgi:hypothetical protein